MQRSTQSIGFPRRTRTRRGGVVSLRRAATLGCAAALGWAGPVGAEAPKPTDPPARVQLQTADGRSFTGELIRDVPSHVLLKIGGVDARFERGDVARLRPVPDESARFAERRAALDEDDFGGRLALAREMFAADQLDAARWELVLLQAALPEKAPGRERVRALLSAVEARRVLKEKPAEAAVPAGVAQASEVENGADAATDEATNGPADPRGAKKPPASGARRAYLSEADINLVRVYEIDLNARDAPGVEVPEIVLREAITEYPKHPSTPVGEAERRELLGRSGHDKLAFLFGLEARSLYKNVRVRHDPENLAVFRREINPGHVARYFEPHFGRGRVPGLDLLRYRPNTTAEAYTNFVTLCRFSYEGLPMIDRFNPQASLLLQWGLPREEALHPAPDVRGWRPRFRSLNDPRVARLREWIDGLVKFAPDYAVLLPPAGDAGAGEEEAAAEIAPETGTVADPARFRPDSGSASDLDSDPAAASEPPVDADVPAASEPVIPSEAAPTAASTPAPPATVGDSPFGPDTQQAP